MSRRKGRYERRQEKRKDKSEEKYSDFGIISNYQPLYESANMAKKGVSWKASVQKYMLMILYRIWQASAELKAGKDIRKGFIEFDINERGKTRHIKSVHFPERVIQKALCNYVLYPKLTRNLIYDNCASQKGKGTHFAVNRVTKFLHHYYRKFGAVGYVLTIDFKKYFDNIEHQPVKEIFRKNFNDKKIIKLADDFVDAFGSKGLGLGSETSQINAIVYVNSIDHYIKEVLRCKYYCRYMDDSVIIHNSKEELREIFKELKIKFAKLGIKISENKTKITTLKRGFTFLKTRFILTDSGKVIRKPGRKSITNERKKLKKQAKLYKQGILTIEDIENSYISWRGSMLNRNARKTVYNMDKLYKSIINERGKDNGKN